MKFQDLPPHETRAFKIIYRTEDCGLVCDPAPNGSGTAICFNEVQLELSERGFADHVWGYCPRGLWQATKLAPPLGHAGELLPIIDPPCPPGVAHKATKSHMPVYYNDSQHWLCIGDPYGEHSFCVQISRNITIVGTHSLLVALWLKIDVFT